MNDAITYAPDSGPALLSCHPGTVTEEPEVPCHPGTVTTEPEVLPAGHTPVERICLRTVRAFTEACSDEEASLAEVQQSIELLLPHFDQHHREVVDRRIKLRRAETLMQAFVAVITRR